MDARLLVVTGSDARVEDRVAHLFDRHYLPLCRLASLLLSDAALAEDVVQEAFLRTFSGWRRLREPDRAEYYLRRSVVNLCRSRFRHREAEQRGNALVGLGVERDGGHRPSESDQHDTVLVVLDAVRSLPPRQRMSIVLRYYLDLPEAEVAELMGCSTGTVKSQVAKAKATLAGVLAAPTEDADDGVSFETAETFETALSFESAETFETADIVDMAAPARVPARPRPEWWTT